jgi:hypothetical protein
VKTIQQLKTWFFRKDTLLAFSGMVAGTAGGFMYYYFIGCRTGTCPLTSSPWLTMLWGATMGYLIIDMFRKNKTKVVQDKDKKV